MEKIVKTLTLAVITFRPAAYPRLQCYWGNQPLPEVSWELESKVPLPKTEKSANFAHFFESGHILRIKIQCLTWEGQGQAWIIFYWGNCPVTFKGQNPGGESFPTFPSGGYAHGSGNYVLSSIQNHLFSSILLYIWMKTWVTWPATSHSNACSMWL